MGRLVGRRRSADARGEGPHRPGAGAQTSATFAVITPRRTRLVRVPDLHDFRRVIAALCTRGDGDAAQSGHGGRGGLAGQAERSGQAGEGTGLPSRLVVVPTRAAATTLARTLGVEGRGDRLSSEGGENSRAADLEMVTRDELYDALHARLADGPRRLSAFERD